MARILVVDDDPDFVEIVRMVLRSKGYDVDAASNGDMALRMMRETPPDLILLDVMMAGVLDGVHVAHTMSESAALSRIPLIMVSSIIDSPMADMFPTDEYIPIDAWLTKPVQPGDLLAKVDGLIGV
jgi:DNA-binding response OmpR family regulator